MPITISYDLSECGANERTYIRSALERFRWRRLGGSVFRYEGVEEGGARREDWLNHVIPALMFIRSYMLKKKIPLRVLTLDAASSAWIDHSDNAETYGSLPQSGNELDLGAPTNPQSSERALRDFVDQCVNAIT